MSNITKQFDSTPITFNDDGWFNATEAAKAFDKETAQWLRLPSTVEYMTALAEVIPVKITGLVATKRGQAGGTWLHPKLGVAFARWLDVRFAVWCDAQIDAIMRGAQSIKAERSTLRVEFAPMTDAIVRARQDAGKDIKPHHFSNEADLVNRIALGAPAAKFRADNEIPKDQPLRDYLTPEQVRCLISLQRANTVYIDDGMSFEDRKAKLIELFRRRHHDALVSELHRLNA
jgi:hypothetical protein